MNNKDMNNLLFILSKSEEDMAFWWNNIDKEDQEYALSIIKAYRYELGHSCDIYQEPIIEGDDDIDLTIASSYLKKFQL